MISQSLIPVSLTRSFTEKVKSIPLHCTNHDKYNFLPKSDKGLSGVPTFPFIREISYEKLTKNFPYPLRW